ncbi:MAG TPA: tyrosine/phenylalanine carboxypeptidase domain-containing protein, partial [Polyangiaceae bacterium]
DPWEALYRARASELLHEARIVDAIGTDAFVARAAERFPVDPSPDGILADSAADAWVSLSPVNTGPRIVSDDAADPRSLVNQIGSLAGALRLPIRISGSPDMACAAATGDDLIVVRTGVSHSVHAARRIALHEIYAHALPRARAKEESIGLFSVGTAGASDDEEGRALLIEERHALFDDARRRELAVRHLAARAVRDAANFIETVRHLGERGVPTREAVFVAARTYRGGGLAREVVYLPALFRVRAAFTDDPALEGWCERGRVSVSAARALRVIGPPAPTSMLAAPPEDTAAISSGLRGG